MASPAPACLQALKDATAAWPERSKASDGIMGDAAHQATKSDHNDGNAFDVTHDPEHGCDGENIAALALTDPRTTYVIWNRRIYNVENPALAAQGWRPYSGSNPHDHHCHVSIKASMRGDASPWPWAPNANAPSAGNTGGVGRLLLTVLGVSAGLALARRLFAEQ